MLPMKRMVAMLLAGVATCGAMGHPRTVAPDSLSHRAQRDAQFGSHVTEVVTSRHYVFRPVVMQNAALGATRDTYAYNFFFSLDGSVATMHLPFEFVNMVIYTEQFDAPVDDYSATLVDEAYWRILFTLESGSSRWAVEIVVPLDTGEVQMAVVTADGTMRYIGSLEELR